MDGSLMNGSNSLQRDTAGSGRGIAGQLAYGALFALVLPLLLAAWAFALERRIVLPPVGSPPAGAAPGICRRAPIVPGAGYLRRTGGACALRPFPPRHAVPGGP